MMSYSRYGFFSSPSTIATMLLQKKHISLEEWGTDKDIKDCLGELLTINPAKQITEPGIYVLPPVSLTEKIDAEAKEAVKHHIQESLQAVKDKNIRGRVSLLIPVNCNDNHWRLARIYIDKQKITSAKLWDSFAGHSRGLRAQIAFENFLAACLDMSYHKHHVRVIAKCAGVQKNGFSCMDYVLREIYRILKINNAIANAESSAVLRLEIVKQIANNNPQLKESVDKLYIIGNAIKIKTENRDQPIPFLVTQNLSSTEIRESLTQIFSDHPHAQLKFDEIYAQVVQSYSNDYIQPNDLFLIACDYFNQWVKEEEMSMVLTPEKEPTQISSLNIKPGSN